MARPRKKLDPEQIRLLGERQWKDSEIAAFFRVSRHTIQRRFATILQEAREVGRAKLRDLQWRRAEEGSDKILVHMSKHYLRQHDKIEETVVDKRMAVINRPSGAQTILQSESIEDEKDE